MPDADLHAGTSVPLLIHSGRRASGFLIAFAVLLVLLAGLSVGGDIPSPLRPAARGSSGAAMDVPPTRDDVRTLLTNTPLAIAPADALALNAARPLDRLKLSPARAFILPIAADQATAPTAALDCLTKAVYYEAAVESDTGQRAVAQVVLNRLRSPIFPHSVCGVVFQGSELRTGCQFSFTCDGSLARQPSLSGWMRARRIALAALSGHIEPSVGLATHYHADYVVPYWASSLDKVSTIGAHIFYTMRGSLGRPGAFYSRYDGAGEAEPPPPAIAAATDLTAIETAGVPDPLAGQKARYRTQVREDLMGTLVTPGTSALPDAAGKLRVDESKSGIVADDNKGVIAHE